MNDRLIRKGENCINVKVQKVSPCKMHHIVQPYIYCALLMLYVPDLCIQHYYIATKCQWCDAMGIYLVVISLGKEGIYVTAFCSDIFIIVIVIKLLNKCIIVVVLSFNRVLYRVCTRRYFIGGWNINMMGYFCSFI